MTFSVPATGSATSPSLISGASPYSTPQTKMTNLFNTIDSTGIGSISKSQFQQAFSTLNPPGRFQALGANAIFSQLDPQGTGSVSKSNFVGGMTSIISSFSAGASSNTPTSSISQSQQSLEQLGSQITSSSLPGSVVSKTV